MLGQLAMI